MDIPRLKPRNVDAHKGDYGRALIIAGSRGVTGAACLAGYSAVKSGAGLVTIAVPDRCLETVAAYNPCYMTVPVPDDEQGRMALRGAAVLDEMAAKATSIGIGPGLSRSPDITAIVSSLYCSYAGPMVVDADALNALAESAEGLSSCGGPRILTPHIGEFRRLAGDDTLTPDACRERAKQLAKESQVTIVLKGHRTLVTNGHIHYENSTGNAGMATGGSGDVLTGIITALLGQDFEIMEAAVLGVYIHGLAGDFALMTTESELAVDAETIANSIGRAFKAHGK